jgi:hypothetical protein
MQVGVRRNWRVEGLTVFSNALDRMPGEESKTGRERWICVRSNGPE